MSAHCFRNELSFEKVSTSESSSSSAVIYKCLACDQPKPSRHEYGGSSSIIINSRGHPSARQVLLHSTPRRCVSGSDFQVKIHPSFRMLVSGSDDMMADVTHAQNILADAADGDNTQIEQ